MKIAALDKPSQYVPSDVQYEDVLEYYGQSVDLDEAWPQSVPFDATHFVNDFWMETPDYVTGWDQSLGPVEIEPEEIQQRLAKKDLDQFEDDEIVSTVERRGMVIGFRKDGTSCPICTNKKKPETNNDYRGGMFGTGENAERLKKYYQALGIIALVYILYLVF